MIASSLLVAARTAALPPPRRLVDPGELFAPAQDAVRATLRRIGRGHGRAGLFEITIDNRSPGPVEAIVFARHHRCAIAAAATSRIGVPGRTLATAIVEVPRPRGSAEVVAEISSFGSTFVVPTLRRGARHGRTVVLALASVGLGVGSVAGWTAAQPRVSLSLAREVVAGASVPVAYALEDARSGHFRLADAKGATIAEGNLDGRSGTFELAVPLRRRATFYEVDVTTANRFGSAAARVPFLADAPQVVAPSAPRVVPRPAVAPFVLGPVTLAKAQVLSGKAIVVSYRPTAAAGSVRLIDEQGTVRAAALLNAAGTSMLLAPLVAADQDFSVVVDGALGTRHAQSAVSVRILKAHDMDDAIAEARRKGTGPLVLGASTVASGDAIDVGIVEHEPQLRVALQDPQGTEIGSVPISVDRNVVSLVAPTVSAPATYLIVGTFIDGAGQQTILRPLRVVPASKTP